MARHYGTVVIKRQRGILTLQGLASTPRGQKFIKGEETLTVEHMHDPDFKRELATAMEKLLS